MPTNDRLETRIHAQVGRNQMKIDTNGAPLKIHLQCNVDHGTLGRQHKGQTITSECQS